MKERYIIFKSGYWKNEEVYIECQEVSQHQTQEEALYYLNFMDEADQDDHYIQKQVHERIAAGTSDWRSEEGYESRYIWDFSDKEIKSAIHHA